MGWIGTSGWSYDHWEHVLYPRARPRGLTHGKRLLDPDVWNARRLREMLGD